MHRKEFLEGFGFGKSIIHHSSFIILLALAGCRTADDIIHDYNENLRLGRYAAAAEEPAKLAEDGGKNALLWNLMAGAALDLAGEPESAIGRFDAAESVMDYNDHTSVFAQSADDAFAMMLNDKMFPYDGGGQDRIFTCLYKAIAYASAGRHDSARTELNRAAQHQDNWLYERRGDIAAADARLAAESSQYAASKSNGGNVDTGQSKIALNRAMSSGSFGDSVKEACGFDIFTSGILDKITPADYRNPYVEHVTGVFRWLNGDGGRGFLKSAAMLRPGNPVVARDFRECDAGFTPRDQVWVFVEDGLCPVREEWRMDLPLFLIPYAGKYVKFASMSLPRLVPRSIGANNWNANGVPLGELASIDALVKVEYDVYMRGAIAREITRTVVDVGVQVALAVVAENVKDDNTRLALQLSQLAAAAYSMGHHSADTRSWTALPKRVFVARLDRPASGMVEVRASGGTLVLTQVPEGNSMVFIRKPAVMANCAVKVVGF